jgi:hypothetical protein
LTTDHSYSYFKLLHQIQLELNLLTYLPTFLRPFVNGVLRFCLSLHYQTVLLFITALLLPPFAWYDLLTDYLTTDLVRDLDSSVRYIPYFLGPRIIVLF